MTLIERLRQRAAQRDAAHTRRSRRVQSQRNGMLAECDGMQLVNFSSNDYLGFAQHPEVVAAFQQAAARDGVGSAGSALVTGHFAAHRELERQAAALFGYEAALYTGSGYMANIGILQALLDAEAVCVQDKYNHACLLDGARFSGAALKRYPHADMRQAEARCAEAETDTLFLVSDGVFSMDGDAADLAGLHGIAQRHNATLMIDDAHGVGVLGTTGLGSLQAAGLTAKDVPILVVPAGKALGGQGALILAQRDIIQYLLETARPYLFSTAPAPAMAAALAVSLGLLAQQPQHHARLQENIRHFRIRAEAAGLPMMDSHSAIQPLMAGDNETALRWSAALQAAGFWVSAIRPPTVPQGKSRLRITLTALHTVAQIDALVEALQRITGDGHASA
ncbi:8-amino-7-oxononanoate synthase [Arenimonas sp. GDDSR-1]|uniref:8-amino-7-oxononanoate synthase n=1 Tax=Arenimonas sp. GDDSR-1 TaxID=2950125 RepID=UPI002611E3C0|nr:8-amino-7-oxononanoate synthase [Arenimonas sp. GDDSR-1]